MGDGAAAQPESVVFIDLDHTLLEGPFEPLVFPRVLGEIAAKTGLDFDRLLQMARRENLERMASPEFNGAQAMDWDDIFTVVADRLGVKLEARASEIVRAQPGAPHSYLHPGAVEALERLARGKPRRVLVLATKGLLKYQRPVVKALGLAGYFDEILTPDASLTLKGSVAFYGAWPQKTRLQIMVGDTYEDDVLPAHRFGFKTVLLKRKAAEPLGNSGGNAAATVNGKAMPDQAVRPDAVISTLFELADTVERLENEALHPRGG